MAITANEIVLFTGLIFSAGQAFAAVPDEVRYNEHVRPILSNHCFACHGADEKHREADLRLDSREEAIRSRDGARIVAPGEPDHSALLARVTSQDSEVVMPPPESKKPRLSEHDIAILRRWIEQGARYEPHWAFLPLIDESPPAVGDPAWARNEIDRFILRKLEDHDLRPSVEADRSTLIRRVYLDLIGLLPEPAEVDAFVSDTNPRSYELLVDRLLESPHYGERWGRHWLDQARYADSDGYSIDAPRAMWPYRDWVIQALNRDLPFDQFTIEQLAGDLLPQPTKWQLAATAFHRNTLINEEGGSDAEQFRVEAAIDRVNTTGTVWLGLTVGCAQCHSHKFDPISQREYYQLFAFFNNTTDKNDRGATVEIAPEELFQMPAAETVQSARFSPTTTPHQSPASVATKLMVMQEQPVPRETFLLSRGDFTRPDKKLGPLFPGVPQVIDPAFSFSGKTPSRLDLARWLVHPQNPLTPRVTVNRVWMRYFGRGLVETEDDFGAQGSYPTHPQLLDWLSHQFVDSGWSSKHLHRLIVTSAAYRQSSLTRADLQESDPRNLLLGRQERLRLDAEVIRDAALCASGVLTRTVGGPSVYPPQPEGVYAFTQHQRVWPTDTGPNRNRRTLYVAFYRSAPYPLFTTFDAPVFQTVCTRRPRSNTPLQALTLTNDPIFVELAQALAERLIREVPGNTTTQLDQRIDRAFLHCLCRKPSSAEHVIARNLFERTLKAYIADEPAAQQMMSASLGQLVEPTEGAAMVFLARAIFNTDNFMVRE